MSYHERKILPPVSTRKRKERDYFNYVKSSDGLLTTTSSKAVEPASSNKILAGYMAYEFLTKGTLLGEKLDPARAEALPLASSAEWRRAKAGAEAEQSSWSRGRLKPAQQHEKLKSQSYAEVARLLKSDGAHLRGIVNPTQLARWIQM